MSLLAIYRFNRSADRKLSTRHFNDCSCDKINIRRHEIIKEVVSTDHAGAWIGAVSLLFLTLRDKKKRGNGCEKLLTGRIEELPIALSRQSFSRALFKTGNQFSSPHSFFLALSFSRHRTLPRSRASNIPWPCFGDFPLPAIWELVRGKHQLMRVLHFRMFIFFPYFP